MREDIDLLISDLVEVEESEGGAIPCDGKGLVTLIKALIASGSALSTVRIYRMMKRSGWAPNCTADDYVVNVLRSGLRRLGEDRVAEEIETAFGKFSKGNLEN